MKLSIGYPDPQDELGMLQQALVAGADETDDEGPLFGENVLRELHREVAGLYVDPRVQEYLLAIGQASRRHPQVTLGVSPRGLLVWQRVAQARAFLNDRSFVTPDDLQETALPVLGVRLGVEHSHPETTIREILDSIPVPDAQTPRGRT
jgi:MoxR-like ATPase